MKCQERIMQAIRYFPKTPKQLSDELFVNRRDIVGHLSELMRQGKVFRKFFHNTKTNMPDYFYSTGKFIKYQYLSTVDNRVNEILGDWDSVDMRGIKK